MKQRKKIELTIPTIDLSLLTKLKGGYNRDTFYGGELNPSICIADGPVDHYTYADGWQPDLDLENTSGLVNNDSREDQDDNDNDDAYSPYDGNHQDGNQNGADVGDREKDNPFEGLSSNSPVTPELVASVLAGTGIEFTFNQELLNNLTGKSGTANGAFLQAGAKMSDGSIIGSSIIVLGDGATVSTLCEELFHAVQAERYYHGPGTAANHALAPMEMMMAVFDYIGTMNYGDGIYGDENDDKNLPPELWILLEGLVSVADHHFDFDGFLERWDDSYLDAWKDFYNDTGYGKGSDDDWVWDWQDAYNWWVTIWEKLK